MFRLIGDNPRSVFRFLGDHPRAFLGILFSLYFGAAFAVVYWYAQ
jgi:hypothetical protein